MLVSPAEPPALRCIGLSSPVPESLGSDFIVISRGKMVGVQRKEFPDDFLASLHGDRLAREVGQMGRLDLAVVVLEGRGAWTRDGTLLRSYGQARFTQGQLRRLIFSLWAQGIAVAWTDSMEETAALLADLETWAKKEAHLALSRRPGPSQGDEWGTVGSRQWQIHLLQGFDGIGPVQAERIIDHFGGRVPLSWGCEFDDLLGVPGVGPGRARRLWTALGNEVPEKKPRKRRRAADGAEVDGEPSEGAVAALRGENGPLVASQGAEGA